VRSESDGYLKQKADPDSQSNDVGIPETKTSPAKARQDECRDDESTLLEALNVTSKLPSIDGSLYVEMRGDGFYKRPFSI
jgi:hypothetical protein